MSPLALETAVRLTAWEVEKIAPSWHWADKPEAKLWHELVACILGSNVRFEQARDATQSLKFAGLLKWQTHLKRPTSWQRQMERFLRGDFGLRSRYRFPQLAASRICTTAQNIYGGGDGLKDLLKRSPDPSSARLKLIDLVHGVGPKQASLYLRNIGYAQEFAIIDRHVLQFMKLMGFSAELVRLTSFEQYVFLEQVLQTYTRSWQVSFASVDTAIWVVMRTCRPGRKG